MADCTAKGVLERAHDEYEALLAAEAKADPYALPIEEIAGRRYARNGNGGLVPVESIKPQALEADRIVRELIEGASVISEGVRVFRRRALEKIDAWNQGLGARYGADMKRGGANGNITMTTIDQRFKVERAIGKFVVFGPELQVAETLVRECLTEWAEGAKAELVAVVDNAFRTNSKGQVNKEALLSLVRIESDHLKWKDAMRAILDSMQVVGTKEYPRFYRRDHAVMPWQPISIDIAAGEVTRAR